jgi:hypothetical protein
LREGNVSWSSVRELTRVATRATERDWLEASRGRTVRELEKLVSGHRSGDLPGDAKDWHAERHVLRFEVSGEVLASFREAQAKLRRDAGGPLDDDSTLLLMARQVLGGPTDDGRASYQITLTVCEACERATQTGLGEALPISAEVTEMASCDAQQIKGIHTESRSRRQSSTKNQAARIAAGGADGGAETHVGDEFPGERQLSAGPPPQRASQAISPAVRRAVLLRDRHCCQVPGCRHATFVDVHHLRARAKTAVIMSPTTCSLCAVRTIARVTVENCSLRRALRATSVFGTQTGPRTADRQTQARPMWRHRPFEAYETLALVNGRRAMPCVQPAPRWVATAA